MGTIKQMLSDGQFERERTVRALQRDAFNNSSDHGFWDGLAATEAIPEKLCLIHSEISEALEEYRLGTIEDRTGYPDGKPEGFASELADAVIRIGDLAQALGIELEDAIRKKMAYNRTRPYKHGKTC